MIGPRFAELSQCEGDNVYSPLLGKESVNDVIHNYRAVLTEFLFSGRDFFCLVMNLDKLSSCRQQYLRNIFNFWYVHGL